MCLKYISDADNKVTDWPGLELLIFNKYLGARAVKNMHLLREYEGGGGINVCLHIPGIPTIICRSRFPRQQQVTELLKYFCPQPQQWNILEGEWAWCIIKVWHRVAMLLVTVMLVWLILRILQTWMLLRQREWKKLIHLDLICYVYALVRVDRVAI